MLYPDFDELVKLGSHAGRMRMKARRKTLAAASGNYASPFRGQGLEFHEVREYRPGDDVRNIDWRVTARMDRPFLKVFTEERERTVLLCVDANAAMRFGTRGTFKSIQAARAAAILGRMAQAVNDRIGALLFGDVPAGLEYFAPARSRQPLWRALRALSRHERGLHKPSAPLEEAVIIMNRSAPTGSLVFIIGDFAHFGAGFEKTVAGLQRRCDVVFVRVNDPADRILPPLEPVVFTGGGTRVTVATAGKAGRDAYERQWLDNRNALEDIARRQRIGIIDLHTDKDVQAELSLGLRRIELRHGQKQEPAMKQEPAAGADGRHQGPRPRKLVAAGARLVGGDRDRLRSDDRGRDLEAAPGRLPAQLAGRGECRA